MSLTNLITEVYAAPQTDAVVTYAYKICLIWPLHDYQDLPPAKMISSQLFDYHQA